jgi:hypothetical protein
VDKIAAVTIYEIVAEARRWLSAPPVVVLSLPKTNAAP